MDHVDDGELREQILRLEGRIEELAGAIESCRKIILAAKAAMVLGGLLLLGILAGVITSDPTVTLGAIAAIIGGIVLFGSNTSTLEQATAALKAAEADRAELIGRIDLRVVEGRNGGS
jgi:hypothetical protein